MQTASIVIVFDEFLDALDQVFQIAVVVGVYLLPFQCLHKALATGVVVRIPWPTHAWHHLVIPKHPDVTFASVLHTSVGMVNESRIIRATCLWFTIIPRRRSSAV